jgi:hypothetical protein
MLSILKKGLLVGVCIIAYFFGIRELRQEMHDAYMGTIFPETYGQINDDYSYLSVSSVSFTIYTIDDTQPKAWQFRMPFDSYWLFGTLGLILLGARKENYVALIAIHLTTGLLNVLFVIIGLIGYDFLLISVDFICRYLIPLASLGYVSIVFGQHQRAKKVNVYTS